MNFIEMGSQEQVFPPVWITLGQKIDHIVLFQYFCYGALNLTCLHCLQHISLNISSIYIKIMQIQNANHIQKSAQEPSRALVYEKMLIKN